MQLQAVILCCLLSSVAYQYLPQVPNQSVHAAYYDSLGKTAAALKYFPCVTDIKWTVLRVLKFFCLM